MKSLLENLNYVQCNIIKRTIHMLISFVQSWVINAHDESFERMVKTPASLAKMKPLSKVRGSLRIGQFE